MTTDEVRSRTAHIRCAVDQAGFGVGDHCACGNPWPCSSAARSSTCPACYGTGRKDDLYPGATTICGRCYGSGVDAAWRCLCGHLLLDEHRPSGCIKCVGSCAAPKDCDGDAPATSSDAASREVKPCPQRDELRR